MDAYRQQAVLYQALAHPVRLRILDILARQEACVCHLTAVLHKPQPYVSQQLSMLRDANLVTDRREGTLIYYHLADDHLVRLIEEGKTLVRDLAGANLSFPVVPESAVDNCPCPRCQSEVRLLGDQALAARA